MAAMSPDFKLENVKKAAERVNRIQPANSNLAFASAVMSLLQLGAKGLHHQALEVMHCMLGKL